MKKMSLIGLVVLVAASLSFGSTITLTPSVSSITPGQSFTIQVTASEVADLSKGTSFGIFTDDIAGAFSVTGMVLGVWTDPQFVPASFPYVLTGEPTVDLGSTGATAVSGTINLGTISLASSASTEPGAYNFMAVGATFDAVGTVLTSAKLYQA